MNKTTGIILGLVLIILSFYGGMKYDQSKVASTQTARTGQFAGRAGGARGGVFGGGAMGQILSKDAQSITIALMSTSSTVSTGSAIVYVSASTTIAKTTTIPLSALNIGDTVIVAGSKDASGAISATSIQIRPLR